MKQSINFFKLSQSKEHQPPHHFFYQSYRFSEGLIDCRPLLMHIQWKSIQPNPSKERKWFVWNLFYSAASFVTPHLHLIKWTSFVTSHDIIFCKRHIQNTPGWAWFSSALISKKTAMNSVIFGWKTGPINFSARKVSPSEAQQNTTTLTTCKSKPL